MYYTIYKVTNTINGKIYIGKHQTLDVYDRYFGSGLALLNSIAKHGKKNFKKEILFVFDNEHEMNLKEKELVSEEFVSRADTYNLGVGGEGGPHFKGKTHSQETKKIQADFSRNRVLSAESRKKISASLIGKRLGNNNPSTKRSWITNGKDNLFILKEDVMNYEGYVKGRTILPRK